MAKNMNDNIATWGNTAISKAKEEYPGIQVVDYLFIGRFSDSHSSKEKFKLWLKDGQREFGLYVEIEYNPDSNQIINITFKEVQR